MKKLLVLMTAAAPLFLGASESDESYSFAYDYSLTQQERDRIFDEIHFCIKKLHIELDHADREASMITDFDVEHATRSAIAGAVAGLSTCNVYGVVISSCLNTLGCIAGDSYHHFREAKRHVLDAEYYGFRADELQEQLWRDSL